MQILADPLLVTSIYKFRSLCTKDAPTTSFGNDADNVFVTQSDFALLGVLEEAEKSILKMKRFECLFLKEEMIQKMYSQDIIVSDHLLNLIRSVPQEKVPSTTLRLFFFDKCTLYNVYCWVCKVYSYFCSSRLYKKKVNLITGHRIKLQYPSTKRRKPIYVTEYIRKCPICSQNKPADDFKKKSMCSKCDVSLTIYRISAKKESTLVTMIQILFAMLFSKGTTQFEYSIRLEDPLFQAFLKKKADASICNAFGSFTCKTLQDVLNHYDKFDNLDMQMLPEEI